MKEIIVDCGPIENHVPRNRLRINARRYKKKIAELEAKNAELVKRCDEAEAKVAAWEGVNRANCEKIQELEAAIKNALKISDLWVSYEVPKPEHYDEEIALHKMRNAFLMLVEPEPPPTSGDKDGEV